VQARADERIPEWGAHPPPCSSGCLACSTHACPAGSRRASIFRGGLIMS
jgi:hypothetical protein